jgi:dTDP-4-amino-4,6-dideoxy-D-galactose acyltransferase
MGVEPVCEYLEWDSDFFGLRIARVTDSRITEHSIQEINLWSHSHNIECLYFLADPTDFQTGRLAHENMFRLVDARVTLELKATAVREEFGKPDTSIRSVDQSDVPALQMIAKRCHRDSRFYHDGNFPERLCDRLYEVWIKRSCEGWAQKVLVAAEGDVVQGYITCHIRTNIVGQIGLVGVDELAQGKGVGKMLLASAVDWFTRQGIERISVVTQGRNVRAQRLYQRAGFVPHAMGLWFHRWIAEAKKTV